MPDFLNLEGKTLLVTGATSGIGREVAIHASNHGARIALVARREERLEQVREALEGTDHIVLPFDMSDLDGIPSLVRTAATELGGLDGVVHAAGLHSAAPLKALKADEATALLSVNVTAAMMLAKGMRVRNVHRPGASIVLISSAVGIVGQPGVAAYSASKGAVLALTKSLALEVAREDIRVNCVCPGVVETEMTQGLRERIGAEAFSAVESMHPLGLGTPADVAGAILFLLSPASRWITGSSLVVDGGYTAQ